MTDSLLQIINLNISFNTENGIFHAVKDANLTIYPGQTVSIVGQSGSGKSTLASAIINLLPKSAKITSGKIIFNNEDITTFNEKKMQDLRGSKIALIPQDPMSNLNPVLTIGFQVKEALQANSPNKISDKDVISILQNAGISNAETRINQYPHELSGGLKQRVLIAIAMSCKPQLLIADEPTSALDVSVQKSIMDFISKITKSLNTSMLFITHDLGLAYQRSDHIIVMYKGQIVESGSSLMILKQPQHPFTKALVKTIPLISDNNPFYNINKLKQGDIIKVENLTKEFYIKTQGKKKKFIALDNISFSIKHGSTLAIVGESGSGKSTLANIILNLIDPTSGNIFYKGEDLSLLRKKQLFNLRRKMQVVFQNPYGSLDPMYTIYKSIEEPLIIHKIGNKQQRFEQVSQLIKLVNLPQTVLNQYPHELSGGQRQRVAIARALSLNPEVLILDEAVSALDVLIQDQILKLLQEIQLKFNLTYVFITHNLAVVKKIADEVLVIQRGKIVEKGFTEQIFKSPQNQYTKNLIDSVPIF